ncbi:hypothetical protein KY284_024447 [Solanum tuberosum]|nr:hypothetical protein KY284_024447 [Solanum tuberosum]
MVFNGEFLSYLVLLLLTPPRSSPLYSLGDSNHNLKVEGRVASRVSILAVWKTPVCPSSKVKPQLPDCKYALYLQTPNSEATAQWFEKNDQLYPLGALAEG